jgi:hypothetical protein
MSFLRRIMRIISKDRRIAQRYALTDHMIIFKFPAVPVYQLKLQDVSQTGGGVIVRPDSKLLTLVQIDQELKAKLLSPRDSQLAQGIYQVRIAHITESKEGRFKGHMVVGIALLQKIAEY